MRESDWVEGERISWSADINVWIIRQSEKRLESKAKTYRRELLEYECRWKMYGGVNKGIER